MNLRFRLILFQCIGTQEQAYAIIENNIKEPKMELLTDIAKWEQMEQITPKQLAQITNLSLSYLNHLRSESQRERKEYFKFYKFGNKVFYKVSDIKETLQRVQANKS